MAVAASPCTNVTFVSLKITRGSKVGVCLRVRLVQRAIRCSTIKHRIANAFSNIKKWRGEDVFMNVESSIHTMREEPRSVSHVTNTAWHWKVFVLGIALIGPFLKLSVMTNAPPGG